MKTLRSQSLAEQLKSSTTLVGNAKKVTEIKTLMTPRGYGDAELTRGQSLLSAASTAVQDSTKAAGEEADAAEAMQGAEAAVRAAYRDLAKTARTLFRRDKPSREHLGLVGPEPRRAADFLLAATKLYNSGNYTDAIRAKLATRGYDSSRLSTERALIAEWETQQQNFASLSGAAEDATETQVSAMAALIDWVSEYIRFARIQLAKRPALLEKLGIKVRNQPSKAQREGRQKAAATRKAKAEALKSAA